MNTITISALTGESRNANKIGRTPARYVPTTGKNCEINPTQTASATGAGVPIA